MISSVIFIHRPPDRITVIAKLITVIWEGHDGMPDLQLTFEPNALDKFQKVLRDFKG